MIDLPLIIDDCVSQSVQDYLESKVLSQRGIQWNYVPDSVHGDPLSSDSNFYSQMANIEGCYPSVQFTHGLCANGEPAGENLELLLPVISALPVTLDTIIRAKLNLKIANAGFPEGSRDIPHIDCILNRGGVPIYPKFLSMVYYINDADGETYLYDKKFDFKQGDYQDIQVAHVVEPKKGRMVLFDGYTIHSAGLPKKSNRAIINMAFTYMEKK